MTAERFRLKGDPEIEVMLRRSPRARRLSLRVSALDGRVTLTIPRRASRDEALAFAEDRAGWIAEARERAPEATDVAFGRTLPVEGAPLVLEPGRRPRREDGRLVLPGRRPGAAAKAYLKTLARDRLTQASDQAATALGVGYAAITLRDTRSRWGSCTSEGRLMFSWRLAMAPPEVLRYVAVHEVAHLKHMDHSPAFWALVGRLHPGWEAERDWLRREGAALHSYRFDGGQGPC